MHSTIELNEMNAEEFAEIERLLGLLDAKEAENADLRRELARLTLRIAELT